MRPHLLDAAVLFSLAWLGRSTNYVCQVKTVENSSLIDITGINCSTSGLLRRVCTCNTSLLKGVQWFFAASTTLPDALPGQWLILDPTGRCVASLDGISVLAQPCPPGFYCEGGANPPRSCGEGDHCPGGTDATGRRCPEGYFCPLPGFPAMQCPDGALCRERSSTPGPCQAGWYCSNGHRHQCPQGHYCPFASIAPRKCPLLTLCPAGSKSPGVFWVSFAFLLVVFGLCYVAVNHYDELTSKGMHACTACAVMVASMWAVDVVLAGYLSLMFVAIVMNWMLLRMATCPWYVARFLLLLTLGTALACLWIVNPPWSMLIAGLTVCWGLGWLMSRQSLIEVVLGRILLVCALVALVFVYWRLDPHFMNGVGTVLALTVAGLLISGFVEHRRQAAQGRRVALPFATRWRSMSADQGAFRLDGAFLPTSPVPPVRPSASGRPLEADSAQAASACGSAGSTAALVAGVPALPCGAAPAGVSFHLSGVNFDLPSGDRLLKEVTLSINPGRRVAVMGPSGSGKSTLLAVLSGRASYGRVDGHLLVSGHQADDLRFLRNVTGFVPQDDVLHGELTVQENIRFQAALRLPARTSDVQVDASVRQVVTDLNLASIISSRVGTPERRGVSGGQRKRVSIAMELVSKPLLLFADEPTSGLDSTTSHEVVRNLNAAAVNIGTTAIAVIHQPRYETLCLFDDLVLLGVGGCLVYAGPTAESVRYFSTQQVTFPPNANPADVLLDAIQAPEAFADAWPQHAAIELEGQPRPKPQGRAYFARQRVPFFRAILIYMDRSTRQSMRAATTILTNQGLCVVAMVILTFIVPYERVDQFLMQSVFASLFLMLLQGVAAQRIFGADLLITWREARVGMPMVSYFIAKDLAALFEVTLASIVFTAAYGSLSGMLQPLPVLFAGTWAFVYAVYGLSYVYSIVLSPGAAQMCAVVLSFIAFCMCGVNDPPLSQMSSMFNGRGWMIPALSPIRWHFGYMLTNEARQLTELTKQGASWTLLLKGYDLQWLDECDGGRVKTGDQAVFMLGEAWVQNRGWVCSIAPLLLLGVIFRFLAGVCLVLVVNAQTSGWARFWGTSEAGLWKIAGHLLVLLMGTFVALFLFAEVYVFGIVEIDFNALLAWFYALA